MSMDKPEQEWPTLTAAARSTGYSRDALRQRIRRGKLRAVKGNRDGLIRIDPADLADLPSPETVDDQEGDEDVSTELAVDVLRSTVDDLRSTVNDLRQGLERTRTTLDAVQADRLVDRGRAERAEAQAAAERTRAETAEARLSTVEAALAEARQPWMVRVIRAFRR